MLPQNAAMQMNQTAAAAGVVSQQQRFPVGSPINRSYAVSRIYSPQTPQQIIRSQITGGAGTPNFNNYARTSSNVPNTVYGSPVTQNFLDRKKQFQQAELSKTQNKQIKKKGKLKDKILSQKVRDLVPESQAYMDLLAFERKLDSTIMRKRLDIQEALKRPFKIKKKLRIFISNQFYPGKADTENEDEVVSQWELRIEGKLAEDGKTESVKVKRKFSSFFKSLVIELDKDLYGPDNHLVEWHRTPQTAETDGFQVKRAGDQNVKCTILMLLDYQPQQYKLDPRLSRFLGLFTATRPAIIQALWQYIKTNKLQNNQEKDYIDCDRNLQEIFQCETLRFSDIPNKLHMLCQPPDPIVINHVINIEGIEQKKTSIYDIEVEIDDTVKDHMKNFIYSTNSQQEIATLDAKIHENIEQINQLRLNREFFLSFSEDPQDFIYKWLVSQSRDLKTMKDLAGNPEEERHASFFQETWTDEAVSRYFFNKVQQRRAELEQVLGMRNTSN